MKKFDLSCLISFRFAKKPKDSSLTANVSSVDITSSLSKVERSWLDVIDNESSSVTISSSGLATKLLSVDLKDSSCDKRITPESNTVKIKKTKLISTKILDFKWGKESTLNKNQTSTPKSSNTVLPSLNKNKDHIEIVLDSGKESTLNKNQTSTPKSSNTVLPSLDKNEDHIEIVLDSGKESTMNKNQTFTPKSSNTVLPSVDKNEDHIEIVLDSTKCDNLDVECVDNLDNSIKNTDCDILMNEHCDQDLVELPLSTESSLVTSCQESPASLTVISSENKFSSTKPIRKYHLNVICVAFWSNYSHISLL